MMAVMVKVMKRWKMGDNEVAKLEVEVVGGVAPKVQLRLKAVEEVVVALKGQEGRRVSEDVEIQFPA